MDKKQAIYPICGYRWGWCGSEEGCIISDPPLEVTGCPHYMRHHPVTKETYDEVRNSARKSLRSEL